MMFANLPDILNIEQLCSALHIGRNSAYKLLKDGPLKSVRIGKTHRIPKMWLVDYLENPA